MHCQNQVIGCAITYMKLADIKTGLLINFNVPHLKSGIKHFVLYPLRVLRGGANSLDMRERC